MELALIENVYLVEVQAKQTPYEFYLQDMLMQVGVIVCNITYFQNRVGS